MKAYVIKENIAAGDLAAQLTDKAPSPKPADQEVLVDVHTAALNFFDLLQVQGLYQVKVRFILCKPKPLRPLTGGPIRLQPPHPYVAGCEMSGTIAKNSPIPDGCPFIPGVTRVFGAGQGAFAEQIAVNWWTLIEVPEGMSMEAAAGLYITYPTSYAGLKFRANLQPGETLLIHAAAGGVGLAALQIGKAMGATVIAACGSQEKLDVCKRYGADYGIDYTKKGWQDEVKKITNGKGVDVVYDPVGMIVPSMKCIAWNGRIIVVGFAGATGNIEKIPANLILLKNIAVKGVHWGAYVSRLSGAELGAIVAPLTSHATLTPSFTTTEPQRG